MKGRDGGQHFGGNISAEITQAYTGIRGIEGGGGKEKRNVKRQDDKMVTNEAAR